MIKVKGNTLKERMEFILHYVINRYNSHNRCMKGGGDCYYKLGNNKCAVGLFLPDSFKGFGFFGDYEELIERYPSVKRFKNFKGIDDDFFCNLQVLHDEGTYWSKYGLSTKGIKYVKKICNGFDLDVECVLKH